MASSRNGWRFGRSKRWNSDEDNDEQDRKAESDVEDVKKKKGRGLMQRVGGMLIGMGGKDSGGTSNGRRDSSVFEFLGEEDAFDLMFTRESSDDGGIEFVPKKNVSKLEFNVPDGPLIPAHCGECVGVEKTSAPSVNNNGRSMCNEKELRRKLAESGVGSLNRAAVYVSKASCDNVSFSGTNTGMDNVDSGKMAAKIPIHPFGGIERALSGFRKELVCSNEMGRRKMPVVGSSVSSSFPTQSEGSNVVRARSRTNSFKNRKGKNSTGSRSRSNTLTKNSVNSNKVVEDEDYDSDSSFHSMYSYHSDLIDTRRSSRSSLDFECEWHSEFINKCQLPDADGFWDCNAEDCCSDTSSLMFSDPLDLGDSVDLDVRFYEAETRDSSSLSSSSSCSAISSQSPPPPPPPSSLTRNLSAPSLLSINPVHQDAADSTVKTVSNLPVINIKETRPSSTLSSSNTFQRPPPPPPPSPRFDRRPLNFPPSQLVPQRPSSPSMPMSSNSGKNEADLPVISLFDRSLNFWLFEID